MNGVAQFLKIYLQANLLLVLTFIIFRAVRVWLGKSLKDSENLVLLRLAQGVFILSLMTPLGLSLIPSQNLPSFDLSPTRMLPEPNPIRSTGKLDLKKGFQNANPSSASKQDFVWFQIEAFKKDGISSVAVLIGIGILISSFILWRKRKSLKNLVSRSISIRELGKVSIQISEEIQVPFSAWIEGRAYVIVPNDLVARVKDYKIAVRHELQHHRQGDTLWVVFIEYLLCVFFINPILYVWRKTFTEIQEFSCDEALIGRKKISSYDYGVCLVRVAESLMESKVILAGTTGMAFKSNDPVYFKSFLRRRIEMLEVYHFQKGRSKRHKKMGILLGTAIAFATIAIAYGSERSFRQNSMNQKNPGEAVFDSKIQEITERILKSALEKSDAAAGFVLVSDPYTGKLLAAANQIRDKSATDFEKTWALSYPMAVGSVTKPIVAAAAIEQGVTEIDERHNCEKGNYKVEGKVYHDHSPFDHLTTAQTLAQSSDICSMKIGQKLGVNSLYKSLKKFGFGTGGTAKEFPEAASGDYSAPSGMPKFEYIHLISVGGASSDTSEPLRFTTTALEVLYAYGAIANGGNLMKPLLSTASDSDTQVVRRVLSEKNAKQVKDALALTVIEGTGTNARSPIYSTAGKTSTGHFQASTQEKEKKLGIKSDFGGFAGFAPVKNPKIAVYSVVIAPKKETVYGNVHAAPIFRQVTEEVLQYMNIASDQK